MRDMLKRQAGAPVLVVPASRTDWTATLTGWGWERILLKLQETVDRARRLGDGRRVTLVGHSVGGVMSRLYLSPDPFRGHRFRGLDQVSWLITLGSPHLNVRGARLRRWVDQTFPGAYFAPRVAYSTVAGRAIRGDRRGKTKARLAHWFYRQLCGEGAQWGDGIVPLASARLEGARNLVLDAVGHAPIGGKRWYGTPEVVRDWWNQLGP
jgi:pimeloyl-ACP methyl ester carboxylesterase